MRIAFPELLDRADLPRVVRNSDDARRHRTAIWFVGGLVVMTLLIGLWSRYNQVSRTVRSQADIWPILNSHVRLILYVTAAWMLFLVVWNLFIWSQLRFARNAKIANGEITHVKQLKSSEGYDYYIVQYRFPLEHGAVQSDVLRVTAGDEKPYVEGAPITIAYDPKLPEKNRPVARLTFVDWGVGTGTL